MNANGENPKVIQELLRHANLKVTMDTYVQAVSDEKRNAQSKVVKMLLPGIRKRVREVDGDSVARWYENLTTVRELSPGTAVRHFNVMHHMMKKAATIWSKDTGIDRNPADQVGVKRTDDQRDRYLSEDELRTLKLALDEKIFVRARMISTRRIVGSG